MDETGAVWAVVLWLVAGAAVGAVIGQAKGRADAGALAGALLGPIGWIIAALLDYPHKCPACLGGVPEGATVCKHCGRDLPRAAPVALNGSKRWNDATAAFLSRVVCPQCGAEVVVEHERLSEGVKCETCGTGFVPQPSKHGKGARGRLRLSAAHSLPGRNPPRPPSV